MSRSQPPVPQEELENFPLPSVRHSQTVLNQLRYPSVLLLVCQDADQSKPDVHFFHCDEVEVRRAAVGSGVGRGHASLLRAGLTTPPPPHPAGGARAGGHRERAG